MKLPSGPKVLTLSRRRKRLVALSADIVLACVCVAVAYYLRLGVWVWPTGNQFWSYIVAVCLALPFFVIFGLYRAIFRYAGWDALVAVSHACLAYGVAYAVVFTAVGVTQVPRTIGIIQPVLLFLAVGGVRAAVRYWLSSGYLRLLRLTTRSRIIIYGAGMAGRELAAVLANNKEMQVVGFIDDDVTLHRSVLNGHVIYPSTDLTGLIDRLGVSEVLLAMPSVHRRRLDEILTTIRGTTVTVRKLPAMSDLAQGRVTVNDLRDLDIDDLLGRAAVEPDVELLSRNTTGKVVTVTGAGGSIGSELCRQIVKLKPSKLLLIESNEFALYSIHRELSDGGETGDGKGLSVIPLLASVQDCARMRSIFSAWKPQTLYHAAAYKHVPLVEHNPAEGLRNNVFGTLNVAKAAIDCGVEDFVLVSTDKAVRPTNIMGASKRVAEIVLQALAANQSTTRLSMVRFGNVLGSSGSVVPLFRSQIKAGGPITITHEEVTRYFMTIPEAAQLVVQAGAMAHGGDVFVLDMGDPVRIVDLARKMIDLSGLTERSDAHPLGDIEFEVIGLRPGEKLYEELLIGDDPQGTTHPRIMKANDDYVPWPLLERQLNQLQSAISANDVPAMRESLVALVPGFKPDQDIVDWIHSEEKSRGVAGPTWHVAEAAAP